MSGIPLYFKLLVICILVSLSLASPSGASGAVPGGKKFEIQVEGLEGEVLKNVELALSSLEGMLKEEVEDDLRRALFLKEATKKVQEALKPFGYYQAQVKIILEKPSGSLRLLVKVKPGEPIRIDHLKIEIRGAGASTLKVPLQETLLNFPLKEGDILRQDLYEESKKALQGKALEAGFLDSNFSVHTIRLSLKEHKARIELVLETGPRYYFGPITYLPPLTYPENFLQRFLTFKIGEPFSYGQLASTQGNFINSGRFTEASVEADQSKAKDHRIPVNIRLSPAKPKRFKFGVGYQTDQGPGLVSNYQDLNFDLQGDEFNGEFLISERTQGAGLDYTLPAIGNPGSKTTLKLGFRREITDTYDTRSQFSQGEYVYPIHKVRWGSGYLRILRESFSIGEQKGLSTFLIPGVKFWERRYDDIQKPSKGFHYSLETRGGIPLMGTEGFLGQFLFQGDAIFPMGKGFSLLLRTQEGITLQTESFTTLPPSLRFFAGGDQSVRGYAYQSLGPKDANGHVIGGRHLIVGSLEIEKAISKIWGLAVFYDFGNAFDDFSQFNFKQGAGLGIRFYTPVGPIRLDLARQLGETNPQFRIHLSIGFGL